MRIYAWALWNYLLTKLSLRMAPHTPPDPQPDSAQVPQQISTSTSFEFHQAMLKLLGSLVPHIPHRRLAWRLVLVRQAARFARGGGTPLARLAALGEQDTNISRHFLRNLEQIGL